MAAVDNDYSGMDYDSLLEYVRYLEKKVKELEAEKMVLKREIKYYKDELEKMISPPLIEAVVLEVLPDGRAVVKSSTGPNLVVTVSGEVSSSKDLRPGMTVAINQRGSSIIEILPGREDPYVRAMEVIDKPRISYDDIGGLDKQIREIRETVELPLTNPDVFRRVGIDPPKGVLLYGPPGTGKTLLAKAVANATNSTFIRVVASEFVQKFIGEGARIVREVFELARKKAPAIIFIDEIDAIAAKRMDVGTSGEREVQRTMMQLLSEMDGFDPLENVRIMAATNRIDILDPAILRPGRFDRLIEVPLPDEKGRLEIFRIHTRRMNLAPDVSLERLARVTDGFSGADIKGTCVEAGYNAIRRNSDIVSMDDFIKAINKIGERLGITRIRRGTVTTAF